MPLCKTDGKHGGWLVNISVLHEKRQGHLLEQGRLLKQGCLLGLIGYFRKN